ncbi:TPA: hypothetical protein DD712_00450 [Candidatus Acetothermia bacterium]|nr:hypothetical protein [Candidatus Acetothermia bacterium]
MKIIKVYSVEETLARLEEATASTASEMIIAGGTDLFVKKRAGIIAPSLLLDISAVDELRTITEIDGKIEIGAVATFSEILDAKIVQAKLPILVAAIAQLGSVQIRNRATIGGNIVNASPAGDSLVPLYLLDAMVIVRSARCRREIPIVDFIAGPGQTVLAPAEFIERVSIPLPDPLLAPSFHKVGRRKALTISICSLGTLINRHNGIIKEARIAFGAVAPTVVRAYEVESLLAGATIDMDLIAIARRLIQKAILPIGDIRASAAYRRQVAEDLLVAILTS